MRKMKQIISILTCILMLACPVTSFADDIVTESSENTVALCDTCEATEDADGNVVHEESCENYVEELSLMDKVMVAETVEDMYMVVLNYMNNNPDALLELTADEISIIRDRIAELDPEGNDTDTQDFLDTLEVLPNGGVEEEAVEDETANEIVTLGNGFISAKTCTGEEFLQNADEDGNIKLLGDVILTTPIIIASSKKITLDLNGHVLSSDAIKNISDNSYYNENIVDDFGRVIVVYGELTINDSNPTKENKGTLTAVSRWIDKRLDNQYFLDSDKNVYGSSEIYPDRYYWSDEDSRKASGNRFWVYDKNGSEIIKGGVITGGVNTSGGGIYVGGGKVIINGGTIAGNRALRYVKINSEGNQEAAAGNGGGIYATAYGTAGSADYKTSTIVMNGGSIKYNWTDFLGGGIALNGNTKFYMNSGNLTGNSAQGSGGGSTVRGNSTFYLGYDQNNQYTKASAPVVQNNRTYSTRYHGGGGGLEVDGGSLEYVVGKVINNRASGSGGGIYCYRGGSVNAKTANSVISDNRAGGGAGIYLQYGDVNLDGCILENNTATGAGGAVGIRVGNFIMTGGTIQNNYAGNHGGAVYVTSQNNYSPHNDNGDIGCSASVTGTTINNNRAGDHGGAIYVSVINGSKNVTVDVNNSALTNNAAGVENDSDDGLGGAIYLSGGTLTVNGSNTLISNNSADGGGAFYVEDRVRKATDGSAPYTVNAQKLAEAYKNGVFKTEPALEEAGYWNVTLTKDYIIPYGDTKPGKVIINAGTITENHATVTHGGVMYVSGAESSVEINGGSFTSNSAKASGGAVYIDDGGNIKMTAGEMKQNTAVNGGAVYVGGGDFMIEHGVLNNNRATQGGAVYMAGDTNTKLTMESGQMNDNISADDGGAIYATNGTMKIGLEGCNGKTEHDYKHTNKGSGRYHPQIKNNKAEDTGGGIAISEKGKVYFYCGEATGNEALYKGVGKNVFMQGGDFYLYGGANIGVPRDPDLVIIGGELHNMIEDKDMLTLKYYKDNQGTAATVFKGLGELNEHMNLPDGEYFWDAAEGYRFFGWTPLGVDSTQNYVRNKNQYKPSGTSVEIIDAEKNSQNEDQGTFDGAADKTMHLYALWAPEVNNITYAANIEGKSFEALSLPAGSTLGSYTIYEQDKTMIIPDETETFIKAGYAIKGWYIYQVENKNANWGYEPKYKSSNKSYENLDYTAMKDNGQYFAVDETNGDLTLLIEAMTFGDIVLIADYQPVYGSLTITKEFPVGANYSIDKNQSFIFHVEGTPFNEALDKVNMDVVVSASSLLTGKGSKVINELPVGDYTVTELAEWSWRYEPTLAEAEITIKTPNPKVPYEVNFVNVRSLTKWLSNDAYCKNNFVKSSTNSIQ